ncbi:MAG: Trk system potassium uptake protein TrkH [Chlamydiae bacterium]|nr:Trk system potassium uptake protein TrkH [Chlamydiota bacterium]
MSLLKQKIHWSAIFGQIGLLLHVPGGMALITIGICALFKEWYAILPFALIGLFGIGLGQLLYRLSLKAKAAHLWDAMIIAALGWVFCSLLAAIPIYWISHIQLSRGVESEVMRVFAQPLNALFESISGFTSTGLTMMQHEGPFPRALQWWRSLLQWTGGLGLVVFVLALTHLNRSGYQLYYAEAHTEKMSSNITKTAHWIWGIYLSYTTIAFLLFLTLGMPSWEAINHAMTVISTGGFTLTPSNFQNYDTAIQISALFIMIVGTISFALHFQVIHERNWMVLWKSMQHRLLYFFLIGGGLLILLLNFWNGSRDHISDSIFEWVSALTTCGYSAINLSFFSPMVKLMLIIGMFIGGATGSTAGGLKIRRIIYLFSGIFLRLISLTQKKERATIRDKQVSKEHPEEEPAGTILPHTVQSERLFTAGVLFTLWTTSLLLGWFFILRWVPDGGALDALFDVTSALSNVGLTSGIVNPDFSSIGKCIFMFLMWIGRLEIIPALVLLLSLPMSLRKDGKKS